MNLVGYASGLPKRAYLMSSVSETGATFAVKDSGGNSVLVGPVGSSVGKWSKDFRNVYVLDFTSVGAASSYTIEVTGPQPMRKVYDWILEND